MNNRLTDLISEHLQNNSQINYYENVNIYTNNNTGSDTTYTHHPSYTPHPPDTTTNSNLQRHRRRRRRVNNQNQSPNNNLATNHNLANQSHTQNDSSQDNTPVENVYTETIEFEPIITSFTINPSDNSSNNILETLSNTFRNLSNSQEGLTIENLNNKTSLITINSENAESYLGEKCSICNIDYQEGQILRKLNDCGHTFHYECVDTWFSRHSTCPICRQDLNQRNN
uniref:RING-type domain-containing protein n=1 Tax=viral metagenome TaxID=1070528 RepID=A0A6C0IV68_9ZZZZ